MVASALSLLRDAGRVMGPAFLVSVAYLDPGNWATAIEAGSRFGYRLVWVVVASNLVAILLQTLSARLGICTGKHLAQVCRESYPPVVIWIVWATCEISIVALDLTMLLGTAVGLNLLLGWPLLPCILMTGLDVVLLLLLVPHKGAIKKSEALTVCLLAVVVACFLVDLMVSKPPVSKLVGGLLPTMGREHLYTAVSLLGANVMPHSFYLHSALVSDQARLAAGSVKISPTILSRLCFLNFCDIGCALAVALVVNVSVLLVSAATFHSRGITVETLQDAHDVMERTLSSNVAPHAFGMALLCAGQLSTFTGTISGQVVLQGFLNVHISTWARRLITRSAAIVPAAILQYVWGDRATYKFLLIAQVALALQLPVTLVPMIKATSSRQWMGSFRNSWLMAFCAWSALGLIFVANLMLLISQMVTGVEGQSPQLLVEEEHPLLKQDLDAAWLGLEPDGPVDLFLDDVLALAWTNPLRFAGMLLLVVAGAAFLALQLWMIITPLPGPAPGRKGLRGGIMPSMLSEQCSLTGDADEDDEDTPLQMGHGPFYRGKNSGGMDEEEEPKESWYQGPPDSPRGSLQAYEDEEQAMVQGDSPPVSHRGPLEPIHVTWRHQTPAPGAKAVSGQASDVSSISISAAAGAAASARLSGDGEGGAASGNSGSPSPTAAEPGSMLYPPAAVGGSLELGPLDMSNVPDGAGAAPSTWQQQQQQRGGSGVHGANISFHSHPQGFPPSSDGKPLVPPPPHASHGHGQAHPSAPHSSLHHHYHLHQQQQQQQQQQHHHHHHPWPPDRPPYQAVGPAHTAGASSSSGRAGLSRSARRQVAACLEDFFGHYYSAHGQYQCPTQGSSNHQGSTPLLCLHTHMSHLCTACAQALYLEVRNCLKALEVLEAASPGLLPDPQGVMDFLTRPLTTPAPAATPALAWHEAAVACLRLDDPVGMARLCARIYSSKLDDSRLLASMPLDSTSMPPNTTSTPAFEHAHVGPSSDPHRPTAYSAHHPLQHPAQQQQHHRHHHYHHRANLDPGTTLTGSPQQQHIGVGAEGEGEEASAPGCLPALLNPQPRRALLAQISRMIGFEQPPAMNQWCLVGPASFLSFGLWSLSLMVSLCQHEARPELWGRYAMVLNKQQGLLRDARLEVATPATGPASPNAALGGGMVAVNSHMSAAGGDGDGGWASPQLVGLSQSHLQQHQQPPQLSTTGFMPLPLTATHLDSRHLATLRLELARHLQVLEIALADRRGPPGTAAGEVAFPKGKEIMQSVIKRLRRRLGYGHGSIPGYG